MPYFTFSKMATCVWRSFPCSRQQLQLDTVLQCGQSFRCECGNCVTIEKAEERNCCMESHKIVEKLKKHRPKDKPDVTCVTQLRGFQSVCLDPNVLETAYFQYKEEHGAMQATLEEWHEVSAGEWHGVIGNRVWRLKQDETYMYYQVYGACPDSPLQRDISACHIQTEKTEDGKAEQQTDCPAFENRSEILTSSDRGLSESKPIFLSKLREQLIQHDVLKNEGLDDQQMMLSGKCKSTYDYKKKIPHIKPEMKETEDSVHLLSILKDYFQLDVDIEELYHHWSKADPYFKKVAADFPGIRILHQEPVENLFSFICSSNNNIARITGMVEKLCSVYGKPVAQVDGRMYHSFPSVSSLAQDGVEENLRLLGFGYRAKFISKSASYIMENGGDSWIWALRYQPYEKAKTELMKLCGVGAKVADCVCLMSLDKTGAIPVDTHVWQFAARQYMPKLQVAKSVTNKIYQEIGDHLRSLWGSYAGWAHSVLFASELRNMQGKKSLLDQEKEKQISPARKREPTSSVDENLLKPKRSKCSKVKKT